MLSTRIVLDWFYKGTSHVLTMIFASIILIILMLLVLLSMSWEKINVKTKIFICMIPICISYLIYYWWNDE